ncbi:MAG: hypothetical protein C5B51_24210 [Terriglobia bacterium]|nr:MAG: hypothetical protein C5B51_24210 [Terriglobia bacterium]
MARRRSSAVLNIGRELILPKGTNVLGPLRTRRSIWWLRSGHVRLSVKEAIIDQLDGGSFFGEGTVLGLPPHYDAATCLSEVKLIHFRMVEFARKVKADSRFATAVIQSLARRLRRCEKLIFSFVTEPAETRLARLLLEMAPEGKGWTRLRFAFTNPELARMIGSSRWRVSYFVNRFQRLGWLRRSHGLWVQRRKAEAFLQKAG